YFKTYYAPNNAVVVVSGDVQYDSVKKLAERYLEPIPAQPVPKPVHLVETPQQGERRIQVKKEVANPYLTIAYQVPPAKDSDYYALQLLKAVLATGNSSRLYKTLVDQKGLASSVFVLYGEAFDPTLFYISAVAKKGVSTEALEKTIYDELDKIKKDGVTERELQKVKNGALIQFYDQVETINGKSNNLGTYEVFFGDYHKMFDAPASYNQITSADLKRVANQYLKRSNRTVGILKTNVDD
ncbi:MAG TPA: insulinase family protein, partial [Chitinophagaceae bacterium]|nr:insulinase family protein [Chitinophagaceae bacterium]